MDKDQQWQVMMGKCRKACRILGYEFKEPEYFNWKAGKDYLNVLWARVYARKIVKKATEDKD